MKEETRKYRVDLHQLLFDDFIIFDEGTEHFKAFKPNRNFFVCPTNATHVRLWGDNGFTFYRRHFDNIEEFERFSTSHRSWVALSGTTKHKENVRNEIQFFAGKVDACKQLRRAIIARTFFRTEEANTKILFSYKSASLVHVDTGERFRLFDVNPPFTLTRLQYLKYAELPQTTQEVITMSKEGKPFEVKKVYTCNGMDISTMSIDAFMETTERLQHRIEHIEDHIRIAGQPQPEAITKELKRLKKMQSRLARYGAKALK